MTEILLFILIVGVIAIAVALFRQKRKSSQESTTGITLGPYDELQVLSAKGGMAKVYKAHNRESDRECVLKILRAELLGDPDTVKKFYREAEIIEKLKADEPALAVPTIYRSGTIQSQMIDLPFIEMEYIPGCDLSDFIKIKMLSETEASRLVGAVAAIVATAHERGIIHRDLKPDNIILKYRDTSQPYVLDFGIAKDVSSKTVTMGGYGTAEYMSPEQCSGNQTVSTSSDVYSLGIILLELLVGRKPISDPNPLIVMSWHQGKDIVGQFEAEIPKYRFEMLARMLDKNPDNRPSMSFISTDLGSNISSTAPQKNVARSIAHVSKPHTNNQIEKYPVRWFYKPIPLWITLIIISVLILILLGNYEYWHSSHHQLQRIVTKHHYR